MLEVIDGKFEGDMRAGWMDEGVMTNREENGGREGLNRINGRRIKI